MILIDYSPLLISCAHSTEGFKKKRDAALASGKPLEDYEKLPLKDIHMFRMWNTLRMINIANRAKYGNMVICTDRKPYWRSEVFLNYKKNRKAMDRTMDWSAYFENSEEILTAIKEVFGWKIIDVPGVEADDSIGTLVHAFKDDPHMIISPDGDYKQLQIYPTVAQYDAIRNKKVIEKDPAKFLRMKIVTGDKKDGIPNIMSHADTFMTENTRQTPISNANKNKWSDATSPLFFCDGDMLERWQFNESMIDMTKVPDKQKAMIMDAWNTPNNPKGNIYMYFASKGYSRFIDQLGDFQ